MNMLACQVNAPHRDATNLQTAGEGAEGPCSKKKKIQYPHSTCIRESIKE